MNERVNVVIVGAGPAGMTAAVYASRANMSCILLDSGAPGGKLLKTSGIENWPGSKEIEGSALAAQMFEHSVAFGAVYQYGDVAQVEDHASFKRVIMADSSFIDCDALIIASGTQEIMLGIPGELEYAAKGVSYCAVCDAGFFRKRVVTVVGGGNSAFEESLYLAQFASEVHILVRRDIARADAIIQEKVRQTPNITVHFETIPLEIAGDGKQVTMIVTEHTKTKERGEIATSGVFPFIGATPVTAYVKDLPILNEAGYVEANADMETAISGIFAAGDVCAKTLRQIVTAASDGAIAAQQVYHFLHSQ